MRRARLAWELMASSVYDAVESLVRTVNEEKMRGTP